MAYSPDKAKIVEKDGVKERLRCCCPFPEHDDKNPSFHIWLSGPHKGRFSCTPACGKGDFFEFIKRMEGTDFKGAVNFIRKKTPAGAIDVGFDPISFIKKLNNDLSPKLANSPSQMPPMPHCSRNVKMIAWYLQWRRKYTLESALKVIEDWGLLWCDDPNYYDGVCYNQSIIIPLHDADGNQVMWQAQFVDGRTGKNKLYPTGGWNPAVLPGLYRCIKSGYKWAIAVEGFWDIAKSWSRNTPAIATMSAWISDAQIQAIYRHLDKLISAYDNDDAGRQAAERMEKELGSLIEVNHLAVPHKAILGRKLDIDEMTDAEFEFYKNHLVETSMELPNPQVQPK